MVSLPVPPHAPRLQAVTPLVGADKVLRVICVGEGSAGTLATLCGPWAALQYPKVRMRWRMMAF